MHRNSFNNNNVKKPVRVNNHIKKYRKSCGLTQGDIARFIGRESSNHICKLEAGVEQPTPLDMVALCTIFDLPVHRIYPELANRFISKIERRAVERLEELKSLNIQSSPAYQHRLKTLKKLSTLKQFYE